MLFPPQPSLPRHVTPIIIFGAAVRPDGSPSPALRRRVEAALRFGAGRPGARYLPTGAKGRFGEAECAVMAAQLRAAGVPAAAILEEPTGTDTLSSVLACRALLRGLGHAGPVYAATSRYHLPRCLLLLRLARGAGTAGADRRLRQCRARKALVLAAAGGSGDPLRRGADAVGTRAGAVAPHRLETPGDGIARSLPRPGRPVVAGGATPGALRQARRAGPASDREADAGRAWGRPSA